MNVSIAFRYNIDQEESILSVIKQTGINGVITVDKVCDIPKEGKGLVEKKSVLIVCDIPAALRLLAFLKTVIED